MMNFTYILHLICILSNVFIIVSLVCKRQCVFFGLQTSAVDISGCSDANTTSDNYRCSVFVTLDHQNNSTSGRAAMETCVDVAPQSSITTLLRNDSTLFTTIQYYCATDSCDSEFLKTWPNKYWTGSNLTHKASVISGLLSDTSASKNSSTCGGCSNCSTAPFCQANFTVDDSAEITSEICNSDASCYNFWTNDYLFRIYRFCPSNDTNSTTVTVRYAQNVDLENNTIFSGWIDSWFDAVDCADLYSSETCSSKDTNNASPVSLLSSMFILLIAIFVLFDIKENQTILY